LETVEPELGFQKGSAQLHPRTILRAEKAKWSQQRAVEGLGAVPAAF
jgi:hypothetical protein